jgi:hypothetical protein
MLFMYRGDNNKIMVSKHLNTSGPIIFMPLYKKVNQKPPAPGTAKKPSKRSIVKKVAPKKIKQALNVKEKKTDVTTLIKPPVKTKPKKELKVIPPVQEQKKIEPVEEVKPAPEPIVEAKKEKEIVPVQEDVLDEQMLLVGRQELESLQMQEFLNELLGTHWQPPAGLSPALVCAIKIVVDWQGAIVDVVVAQSSGVLIYDFSARNALQVVAEQIANMQVGLPQWMKGKEFTITFKQ